MEYLHTNDDESVGLSQQTEYKSFLKQFLLPRNNKELPIHERKQATHTNPYIMASYHIPNNKLHEFWRLYLREMQQGRKLCIYEVCYEGMLVHPFLDLDSKSGIISDENLRIIITKMHQIISKMCIITNNKQLHTLILRNISSSNIHVIMPKIGITKRNLRYLLKELKETLISEIATLIDTPNGLRMIGSGKSIQNPDGSERPYRLDTNNIYLPNNTCKPQISQELLNESSIIATKTTPLTKQYSKEQEKLENIKLQEADNIFANWLDSGSKLTHEHFICLLDGLSEQTATNYYSWYSVITSLSCLVDNDDILHELIHHFSKKSSQKYNINEIDEWIDNHLMTSRDSRIERVCNGYNWNPITYLLRLLLRDSGLETTKRWCKMTSIPLPYSKKRTLTDVLRKTEERITNNTNQPIVPWAQIRTETTIQDIRIAKRVYLLKANMAMGKTKALIRYIQELPHDKSILCLSPRRSLTRELTKLLKECGFISYLNRKGPLGCNNQTKRVICSIESLSRLQTTVWDLVIMDEYCSVLRQLTSSTLRIEAQIVIGMTETIIRRSKQIIGMDADLKYEDIEWLEKILGTNLQEQVEVVQYVHKKHKNDKYELWSNKKVWKQCLTNDLIQNKRVVIPVTSRKESKNLYAWISKEFPNKKVKLYNRDTEEVIKRDFEDLKTALRDVDVLIYTPTLSVGCNYEEEHFDIVYGYFPCKSQIEATTCLQMLYRVRNIKENRYVLLLDATKLSEYKQLPETRKELEHLIGKRSMLLEWGLSNGNLVQIPGKDIDSIEYPMKGFYYELYLYIMLQKNKSRNDLSGCIMDELVGLGVDITIMEESIQHSKEIVTVAKRVEQRGREFLLEEAEQIAKARDITDTEYDLLSKRLYDSNNPLTCEEIHQHTKTTLRKHYGVYTPIMLTKEWILANNDTKRKEAYIRQWMRSRSHQNSKTYHQTVLKSYKNKPLLVPIECLQAKIVEELAEIVGLKSAAIVGQTLTRLKLEESILMVDKNRIEDRVALVFGKDCKSRRTNKTNWRIKSFIRWINCLFGRIYLTNLIPLTYDRKNNVITYELQSIYRPP